MQLKKTKKKFKSPVGINWSTIETSIVLTKREAEEYLKDNFESIYSLIDSCIELHTQGKKIKLSNEKIEKWKKIRNKIGIYQEYPIKIK